MSSYMIKAVLSNPQHPEYGQVTIPFPIPNEEYDHSMELLKEMGLGDVLQRDCQVDEVDSYYGVLKRLEGQSVNVDELDYLAKRLESFCVGEDAQFQGMAAKLDISDIAFMENSTSRRRADSLTNAAMSPITVLGEGRILVRFKDGTEIEQTIEDTRKVRAS